MANMKMVFVRLRRAVRRLRSLVRDDDHDDWYDQHGKEHDKPTNLAGPWSQGGG